jgi:uncharacterized CHY-type Zn-finger protein
MSASATVVGGATDAHGPVRTEQDGDRVANETGTNPVGTGPVGNPASADPSGTGQRPARPAVHGAAIDSATRCVHYNGPTDIVAIKFRCCGRFYPCFSCHAEAESHPARRWAPAEWTEQAILCGACGQTLSIAEYRGASGCPACGAAFNDGCRLHAHLYFEVEQPTA